MMQNEASGIAVYNHRVRVLGFTDDLNILSELLEDALGLTMDLESTAANVGLQINLEKTSKFWSFSTLTHPKTNLTRLLLKKFKNSNI